jgi:hypothetical protein
MTPNGREGAVYKYLKCCCISGKFDITERVPVVQSSSFVRFVKSWQENVK